MLLEDLTDKHAIHCTTQEEWNNIVKVSPNGKPTDLGLFDLPILYQNDSQGLVNKTLWKSCVMTKVSISPNQGDTMIPVTVSFIMADIPGIIEGAAEGKGLGHYFLRHIERNSTLLFLVPADADDIKKEYEILLDELRRYNPEMLDKDKLIVVSKCDMLDDELKAELKSQLDKDFKGTPYMFISSVANQGLTELKDKLWEMLNVDTELPENSHGI
jgi:GTP-binding protein